MHRWLIAIEFILIVVPTLLFLGISFLLLIHYFVQVGIYSARFWLLWLGGAVGLFSLFISRAQFGRSDVDRNVKFIIALTGICGLVSNFLPCWLMNQHTHWTESIKYLVFSLPSLVWFHWSYLVFSNSHKTLGYRVVHHDVDHVSQ